MKEKYIDLLDKLLKDIGALDDDTPWQETEPEWWLKMMELRDVAQKQRSGYGRD